MVGPIRPDFPLNQVNSFKELFCMSEIPNQRQGEIDPNAMKGGFWIQEYRQILDEAIQKIPKQAAIGGALFLVILGGVIDAALKLLGFGGGAFILGSALWPVGAAIGTVACGLITGTCGAIEGAAIGYAVGGRSWGGMLGVIGFLIGGVAGAGSGSAVGAFIGSRIVQAGSGRVGLFVGEKVGGCFSCSFAYLGTCCLQLIGENPSDYETIFAFNKAPLKTISDPCLKAIKNCIFPPKNKDPYIN